LSRRYSAVMKSPEYTAVHPFGKIPGCKAEVGQLHKLNPQLMTPIARKRMLSTLEPRK
jgi:hypothetical protein